MREINSLKNKLSHLRTEVLYLQGGKSPNTSVSTNVCFLMYVRMMSQSHPAEVGMSMLRNCLILNYSIIRNTPVMTLNVKIPKHHFHMGLTAPESHQVKVHACKPKLQGAKCERVTNDIPIFSCPDPDHQNPHLRISTEA